MKCRSCGAPIFYAVYSTTGRKMPIDRDPTAAGSLAVGFGSPGSFAERKAFYVPKPERGGRTDLFTSHFETCPDASSFRRTRKPDV